MRDVIVGIDPGSKGFACVLRNGKDYEWIPLNDLEHIMRIFEEVALGNGIIAIEEVHALLGSSAKSTFQFGYNVGMIHGLMKSVHVPYVMVPPKKWQKALWCHSDIDKVGGKVNTKRTSLNCASRLFPNVDFRRTDKCKIIDDNKVDATLICEYARRSNL